MDVNKGDDDTPNYRSRLVARQLRAHDKSGESFFAPSPPLESLRLVLSMAATNLDGKFARCLDGSSENRTQLSFVDISRAYFNAKVDDNDPTYVQLPEEDPEYQNMCARLLRHMYGTRRAADGWQEEYSSYLVGELGFKQGMACPCLFVHPGRGLACNVHGDDFTTRGSKRELDIFEAELKARYELRVGPRLGPGAQDDKEALVLNRVVRWTPDGIEYEADPRQAEKLVRECGLEGANSTATPGLVPTTEQIAADVDLAQKLHTPFRGSAARANYLSMDRPDCQFAAKEVCRKMAAPTEASWTALKRLCRYLVGMPRLIFRYAWQDASGIDVYSDTDWGGCKLSRKSTSGGCILHGSHLLKSWSSTQPSVSLSSGEAEFYGVLKAAGAGLGMQSLMRDIGFTPHLRVWTDSSAAIGICARQGLGKLRHIDTHTLWVQQAIRTKRFALHKVSGESNPGDLFTKHLSSRERLASLTKLLECRFTSGRAQAAPCMRQADSTKATMSSGEIFNVHDWETWTTLPHLMARDAINEHFPPVVPPTSEDFQDFQQESTDGILQHGLAEGQATMERAALQGRLRHDQPNTDADDHSLPPAVQPGGSGSTPLAWADCDVDEEFWFSSI